MVINKNKEVLKSDQIANNAFVYMLEIGLSSGEYKEANISKWPGEDYAINMNLSYCKNGNASLET